MGEKRFLRNYVRFLRNDVISRQNLIDSLLEHKSNLNNLQCCGVVQDT